MTELALSDCSLDELADIANAEFELTVIAVTTAFHHAIRTGHALNAAFMQVPRGEWANWVAERCTFSATNAVDCRRMAYHERALVEAGIGSVEQSKQFLKDQGLKLPWVGGWPVDHERLRENKMEAQQLRREGLTYAQIAERLAASAGAAWEWCNPDSVRAIRRRRSKERSELRRLRRDKAMKVAGGATHEGYSLLRKAASTLQVAVDREQDGEAKRALENALAKVYQAEDEMFRAVRLTQEIPSLTAVAA